MNDKVMEILYIYSNLVYYTQRIILNSEEFTYEDTNTSYAKLINQVKTEMSSKSLEKYYKTTLLAYIAWIDEQIMLSHLNFKKVWMKNLLQKKYFQTSDLGHVFFINYNNLDDDDKDLKIIYLYVLSLGFEGKYSLDKDELEGFITKELNLHNINLEVDYFNKIYDLKSPTVTPIKKAQLIKGGYLIIIAIISILCIITMYFSLKNQSEAFFRIFGTIQ
tara:strand:+ start:217 stop:873 length:657 start_codon:yes stop_codon:yes gene_type:complete